MTIDMPRLSQAACISSEPSKAVCRSCWDRPDCLAWALESETDGFWGGYSANERKDMRSRFGIPKPERR